jgi:hypothetical protein
LTRAARRDDDPGMQPTSETTRRPVLVVPADGEPIGRAEVGGLIGDAWTAAAETVAIPVARLDPAFFDLRTGVAGEIAQAFVNYRIRLVVVGPLPDAARSTAFTAFVREANRGTTLRFTDSLEHLLAG